MSPEPIVLPPSCSICEKVESLRAPHLLCKSCIGNAIEVIRNSVIENQSINESMRKQINSIFAYCDQYRNAKEEVRLHPGQVSAPSSISVSSVKKLAIQLQKLELINSKMKLNGIEKATGVMRIKVQNTLASIERTQQKIAVLKEKLDSKSAELLCLYHTAAQKIESDINHLHMHSINRAKKYSAQVQHEYYQVFLRVALPNYDTWKRNARNVSKKNKQKLLLFDLPVVELSTFMVHDNRLTEINSFLENLIRLQLQLVRLFFQKDNVIKLPFLEHLVPLLPDSDFYDLVQEKINFITQDGTGSNLKESRNSSTESVPVPTSLTVSPDDTINKIIIEGNVIRIPVSFRTINLQRRTSVFSPGVERSPSDILDTKKGPISSSASSIAAKPIPLRADSSPLKSTLKGKKIVITAHKILTKPFSRLKPKEYLRFVLIVVKIIINFQVFFQLTIDTIRGPVVHKKPSSSTFKTTFNQFRSLGNSIASSGTKCTGNEMDDYNFEKILNRFASMDFYFRSHQAKEANDSELSELRSNPSGVLLHSSISQTSYPNLSPSEFVPSEDSASLVKVGKSQLSPRANVSKLKVFYNNVFNRQSSLTPIDTTENVYGIVSETNSQNDDLNPKSPDMGSAASISLFDRSSLTDSDIQPCKRNYNIKKVMGDVHKILAFQNGNGRMVGARSHTSGPNHDLRLATLSMLAESKAQLEDWDMVSQMYK